MKDYTLLSRADYVTALTKAVRQAKAGERVFVATMAFDPSVPIINDLVVALRRAAKRGVVVTMIVDAINFLAHDHGIPKPVWGPWSTDRLSGKFAATFRALHEVRMAGGSYHIINKPLKHVSLAQAGRSHIKAAVVGKQVFLGGCNLERPEQLDVMVSWDNAAAADTLANWFMRIGEAEQVREAFGDVDVETVVDTRMTLLLDAGVPRQSLIYDEALRLIDDAEDFLYMTCQYFPGGPTAKHLAAAQARGVSVQIEYSHPRAHSQAAVLHHIHQLTQHARGLPNNLFAGRLDKRAPKLHAKVLISDKAAMVGSHNYVPQGVYFGTAELALKSTDPVFGQQLRDFIRQQI